MATSISVPNFYDEHTEANSYDYEEESKEPKPPKESMIGLQMIARTMYSNGFSANETDN